MRKTNYLLFLASLWVGIANASVDRIEPPFWWAQMTNNELQLMVHGQSIGEWSVTTNSEQVKVKSIRPAENPNYLFVDLELAGALRASFIELRFVSTNGEITVKNYEFKQRYNGSAQRPGFSSKDVIYLVTPDRFANGDPSNDETDKLFEKVDRDNPDGRHGGDLAGLINSLDYLSDLGITQIWLNPLQENNQEKYSYHGYSISDLYNIDARYGGNEVLKEFSSKASAKGIGLIMDTIPNHIGLNHWWMSDLPSKDWINNEGEFMQTSHNHEAIQDPYIAEADKVAFNDGWFVPTMPDLNQRNTDLATYLIQNNIWWVEEAGLTGLRVDTLPYGDKNFTTKFNRRILEEFPNLNIVGEEWSTNPAIVSYWQIGKLNQDGFDGGVPSLMDFPLQDALVKSLKQDESWNSGIIGVQKLIANDFQYPNPNNLVVIADNHDMSRIFTQLDEDYRHYKMALTLLMTTRGIPQLFYGTEILMKNPGTDAHGVIRSDFPGGWPGDQVSGFTGEGLKQDQVEAQQFVSKLLNWRKSSPVIHTGELTHFFPLNGVYTYFRHNADSMVMVMINNNVEDVKVKTERFFELTEDVQSMRDVLIDEKRPFPPVINMRAKSSVIYELN